MKNETIASHTFENSNTNPGVWCSTPFLPIRVEIENVTGVAGTHYLYQGSNSLIQEGEPEKLGILLKVYQIPSQGQRCHLQIHSIQL
jgi:hypothetical protein